MEALLHSTLRQRMSDAAAHRDVNRQPPESATDESGCRD